MKTAILIGGGTSVKEGIELGLWERIQKDAVDTFSINYASKTMPYLPNKQVWIDTTFFRNNMNDIEKLHKAGVECHTKVHNLYNAIEAIKTWGVEREQFLGKEMKAQNKLYIGTMGLSGMFALSLACALEYERIFLLGYDFGSRSKNDLQTHYYQDSNIPYVSSGVRNPAVYHTENGVKNNVKEFDNYAKACYNIINVTSRSNINAFPKISYEEFFNTL
jgi:hypothetical protein